MSAREKQRPAIAIGLVFGLFLLISAAIEFEPGQQIGENFLHFFVQMMKVLPCVFILIGLFDVWIKKETVEKHLGHGSNRLSYLWVILLASTTVGGLHVALPIGQALYQKGARLNIVLVFLFAACITRIPMTLFEASFLGWRFTCIRFAVSLPLIIITSNGLARWFKRNGHELPNP